MVMLHQAMLVTSSYLQQLLELFHIRISITNFDEVTAFCNIALI